MGCPVSLDLFAADVDLPGELYLETAFRQSGQGQIFVALSFAQGSSKHLFGETALLCLAQRLISS